MAVGATGVECLCSTLEQMGAHLRPVCDTFPVGVWCPALLPGLCHLHQCWAGRDHRSQGEPGRAQQHPLLSCLLLGRLPGQGTEASLLEKK